MTLTGEQRESWERDGFLVLEGFCAEDEVEAVQTAHRRAWDEARPSVVVDDVLTGRRCRISDVAGEQRGTPFFKVSDLYLEFEEVRRVVLGERLSNVVAELLGDAPVLCNTLNLLRSSQQEDHVDSIYMTPRTPHKLVASWIALEDAHPDAGQLRYYPGSHRIPLFRFSNGTFHVDRAQMDEWEAHYREHVRRMGLEPRTFAARRGDVFIWHADLLHGGSKVTDPERTRDSIVSHYYALADAQAQRMTLRPLNSGYWWEREPQAVPGEEPLPRRLARRILPARARQTIRRRLRVG